MRIVESVEYHPEAMDASRTFFKDQSRPQGLHVTQVINSLANSVLRTKPRPTFIEMTAREQLEMSFHTEIGFIWEEMLSHYFRQRMLKRRSNAGLHEQMPLTRDGIHLTPDAIDMSSEPWWLEEYKATKRSQSKWDSDPEKHFFEWFCQIKSYLGALDSLHCRLFVYWVVGDWSRRGPSMWRYDLEFTKQEIEDNWSLLLCHARDVGLFEAARLEDME